MTDDGTTLDAVAGSGLTVDTFGPQATILTGQIGSIGGVPVIVSEHMRQDLNASGVYDGITTDRTGAITVNRGEWRGRVERPHLARSPDRIARITPSHPMTKPRQMCEGLTAGQPCKQPAKAGTDPARCGQHTDCRLARIGRTKARFLERLREGDDVYRAAANVGLSKRTAYTCREIDPDFDTAWTEAVGRYWGAFENELRKRAMHGWTEDV